MKLFAFTLFLLIAATGIYAQSDSLRMVKYSPSFSFKEGLYLNFGMCKNNTPIPKSRIIANSDYNSPEFFNDVLSKDIVYYYDNLGNKTSLKVSKLWGYCRNGFIYISVENDFYRITMLGSISHFLANHTYYSSNAGNMYNYYYDPYYSNTYSHQEVEVRQYLLDFSTGRILDYSEESIEVLLMADPELHDEYAGLSNKKKKQLKFMYMRKFNEKHPLYFPQN